MVLNPAVANIASVFLLNDAHRRELMSRASRVANATPAFRWNEDVVMAAFQTGWNTMAHEFSLAIPWSNDFREWLLPFLVEHEFGDLLDMFCHSDELVTLAVAYAAAYMKDLAQGALPNVRRDKFKDGLVCGFQVVFDVQDHLFTPAKRTQLHGAIRSRIRPLMQDPREVPPDTKTFVRVMQVLPNRVFWEIVEVACDERVFNGPGFSFAAHYQSVVNALPELAMTRNQSGPSWNLQQAHRGFVEAIYRRSG